MAAARSPAKTIAYLQSQIPIWYTLDKFPAEADPLGVVRAYLPCKDPRVLEAAAFFAALFAWGRRDIAIAKTQALLPFLIDDSAQTATARLRDVFGHTGSFKHRTFTQDHVRILVLRLQDVFDTFGTLEAAFAKFANDGPAPFPHRRIENALNGFRRWFFMPDWVAPVGHHVASPERGSACKRLNLMLRWLVRPNDAGLDLGLWTSFAPQELLMPLDVHVINSARHFGLLTQTTINFKAAVQLTEGCRQVAPQDPLLLDYVLFGLSNQKQLGIA